MAQGNKNLKELTMIMNRNKNMIEKLSFTIVLAKLNKFNHIKYSCLSGQR